jgi:DNA-binding NarL/FixJ family response regulator
MQVFWERAGILGPIYRLAGQGLSNDELVRKLGIAEIKVEGCIARILQFLKFKDRLELIRDASPRATG